MSRTITCTDETTNSLFTVDTRKREKKHKKEKKHRRERSSDSSCDNECQNWYTNVTPLVGPYYLEGNARRGDPVMMLPTKVRPTVTRFNPRQRLVDSVVLRTLSASNVFGPCCVGDSTDNIYVVFRFNGTVVIENTSYTTPNVGIMLLKYNLNERRYLFHRYLGDLGTAAIADVMTNVLLGSDNSIYIVGGFFGVWNQPGRTTPVTVSRLNGNENIYVARCNEEGVLTFVVGATGVSQSWVYAAIDPANNVYVSGSYSSTATFGTTTLTTVGNNTYVAALSNSATWIWASGSVTTAIANGAMTPGGITLTTTGLVIISGTVLGNVTYGSFVIEGNLTDNKPFVMKFNTQGIPTDLVVSDSSTNAFNVSICTDIDGEIFVLGLLHNGMVNFGNVTYSTTTFNQGFYILKLTDDIQPVELWFTRCTIAQNGQLFFIIADPFSKAKYVWGAFTGTLTIGTDTMVAGDTERYFLARRGGIGQWNWGVSIIGQGIFRTNPIGVGSNDQVINVGAFRGQIFTENNNTVTPVGAGNDGFILVFRNIFPNLIGFLRETGRTGSLVTVDFGLYTDTLSNLLPGNEYFLTLSGVVTTDPQANRYIGTAQTRNILILRSQI